MNRINTLLTGIIILLAGCQETAKKEPGPPPNFIFILVDDLGWADVTCNYPESFYETPHIDELAQRGVRFTQAYSANPVCSPTRAAIMTGKHPNRVGITDWIQEDAAYASMVEAMDENVGRLLSALEENELDKNTWIIFTSDNGGLSTLHRKNAPTANGPLRAGKGWCYEGGIRVPLIISGPGISRPGKRCGYPVISMDLNTTVLSLASLEYQSGDGENLLPVLTQDKLPDRDILFWHFPHYHGSAWKPGSALRKGEWKIVVHYEDQRTELFNLADDPEETTDLSLQMPEKTEELKKILDRKLMETGARFPKPNPEFEKKDFYL